MKKKLLFCFVVFTLVFAAGCQSATTAEPTSIPATEVPPTVVPSEVPQESGITLELIGINGETKTLTLEEIQKMPAFEGQGGMKSSTGKITLPANFKGVLLQDLVAQIGDFDETMGVQVEASDGYFITFSYDQIMNGSFITYDPGTGDENTAEGPLQVIIAYEREGEPIPEKTDGALRLVIVGPKDDQVTDGHWAVKWVSKITVKSLAEDWVLHLEGALVEDMDRATFESGASPNCHYATWTDEKAQEWAGIPLWLLVGRVDDEVKHEDGAYNEELALQGYPIDIVAGDGYTLTLDSARINRNDNIIVAFMVNGNALTDKNFPLRLVGSDLEKSEMVGGIASIVLHLPESATTQAEPTAVVEPTKDTAAAPAAGGLTISGNVGKEMTWSLEDLGAMTMTKIQANHPKSGELTDYEGILISELFAVVKPAATATKVKLVASDGYSAEMNLADLIACKNCMVAFNNDNQLKTVMPDQASSLWVKDLVSIEIQ